MKTNEIPEKVYFNPLLMEDGESIVRVRTFERQSDSQIEYTRTDAFIEKASEWFKNNWREYVNTDKDGIVCFGHWEKDFRKYMKGE